MASKSFKLNQGKKNVAMHFSQTITNDMLYKYTHEVAGSYKSTNSVSAQFV